MVLESVPRAVPVHLRRALVACSAALLFTSCGGSTVQLAGTVERTALELTAPDAELVVDLPLSAGDRVAPGEVIVQLEPAVARAELRAAQAAREAATALLTEAKGEFERVSDLRSAGVNTQQSLDTARRKRDEALAMVAER